MANDKTNEAARLEALQSYNILDTPSDFQFDNIVYLAQHICSVPIALISLVDEERQWFKAKVGLEVCETERDISFCTHAIKDTHLFEVTDASEDQRFVNNPLVVGDPHIRFYAGFPLITKDNHHLGTLCVIDKKPRQLTSEQKQALEALAYQTVSQLELVKANTELNKKTELIEQQYQLLNETQKFSLLREASAKAAHEINNPLAIIQANADILNSIDMGEKEPFLKEKLKVIYENIERIKAIVLGMKNQSPKP